MKTGGTSLRKMLIEELGEKAVYPNDKELEKLPNGWYPESEFILQHASELRPHQILVGHHPYSLYEKLKSKYKAIAFLREPVSRTLSIMSHRKRLSPHYAHFTFDELLEDNMFVEKQILNYQTKVLSMDIGAVNDPIATGKPELQRALDNLRELSFIGINEQFPASCRLFDKKFNTRLSKRIRYDNRDPQQQEQPESVINKIRPLVSLDIQLYEEAKRLFFEAEGG